MSWKHISHMKAISGFPNVKQTFIAVLFIFLLPKKAKIMFATGGMALLSTEK